MSGLRSFPLVRLLMLLAGLGSVAIGMRAWNRSRGTSERETAGTAGLKGTSRNRATPREPRLPSTRREGQSASRGWVGRSLHWVASHPSLLGAVAALAVAGACGGGIGLWLYKGGFNTAASKPHYKIVAVVTHNTMINSVKKRAEQVQPPQAFTPEQVLAGAKSYEEHCLACHGGSGVSRAVWAATMTPPPPYVIDSARNWSKSDLYIILLQGVKMSAMPAWGEILPERELWNLVAFLDAMPDLSPADYRAMREKVRAEPTTAMGASGPAVSAWPQPLRATQPLDRGVTPDDTALPPGAISKHDDDASAAQPANMPSEIGSRSGTPAASTRAATNE